MAKQRTFPCESCGADLAWDAGSAALACPYCGFERRLGSDAADERDLVAVLERRAAHRCEDARPGARSELRCGSCHASVVFEGTLTASHCAWCGAPVQRAEAHGAEERIPVDAVLPFALEAGPVRQRVGRWLRGLWFAPNAFAKLAVPERLQGVYLPYWTFDAVTRNRYRGRRGDRVRVRRGSKTEVRVHWMPVTGRFERIFDDEAAMASRGLPEAIVRALEPWPLDRAVAFEPGYLAGFQARTYDVSLAEGWKRAQSRLGEELVRQAKREIGGDEQMLDHLATRWEALGYKHVLLPVWMLAFRWRERVYRVVVNGVTGEVQGERPWSRAKISLAVGAGLAAWIAVEWWHRAVG